MKLVTSYEHPPIPWRKFDWVAFDEDEISGVCGDPDCHCRENLVRGWGETEEAAIQNFVGDLLERYEIDTPIVEMKDVERLLEREAQVEQRELDARS